MIKPLTLKLLILICANTLLLSCSEPESQSTRAVTANQAQVTQEVYDQVKNTLQRAGQGASNGEWQAYGGDTGSTKYTALDDINLDNVEDLQIMWRRPALAKFWPWCQCTRPARAWWILAAVQV